MSKTMADINVPLVSIETVLHRL